MLSPGQALILAIRDIPSLPRLAHAVQFTLQAEHG
jgi:hypothetical protein